MELANVAYGCFGGFSRWPALQDGVISPYAKPRNVDRPDHSFPPVDGNFPTHPAKAR